MAKPKDSGNYTCNPSNSDAETAVLHVIHGRFCLQGNKLVGIEASCYVFVSDNNGLEFVFSGEYSVSAVTSSSQQQAVADYRFLAIVLLFLIGIAT